MKNSKAEATRWLRQAENDLAAARLVLQGGFFAQRASWRTMWLRKP